MRFTEICSRTNLSNNRAFRILSTLCEWGYLEKDTATNEYQLGSTILVLGELYQGQKKTLKDISAPIIADLAKKSGDIAVVMVPYGDYQMIGITAAEGAYTLQGRAGTGEVFSLHGGASSRFFIAALSDEERSKLLDQIEYQRYTQKTITNRADLEKEVQVAVEQGYAVAEEDLEPGVVAVAAPVYDFNKRIIAAISLVVPTVRYSEEHKREMIEMVVSSAKELSIKLGYIEETKKTYCA